MLAHGHTFGRVTSGQALTPVTATVVTVISQQCRGIGYKLYQRHSTKPFTSRVSFAQLIVLKIYRVILNCKGFFPSPTEVRGFQNQEVLYEPIE
jgi:hypothetical protein